ncbi:MAG: TlpA family protein disulfide reductase [Gaiellaceae bacterium]
MVAGALTGAAFLLLRASPTAPRSAVSSQPRPAAERKLLPALAGDALNPPPPRIQVHGSGQVTFIDVWASWCLPCQKEAPLLARLARRYRGEVRFIGLDVEDTRSDARAFVRRYGIGFPSIFDPRALLTAKLDFSGLPTAYLVDRRGRIAAVVVGRSDERRLVRLLEALIAERGSRLGLAPAINPTM